jgi:hypothetical protein
LDVVFGSTNDTHQDYILATQNNQSKQTNKQINVQTNPRHGNILQKG